jgi:anti-anti-sigma factor
VDDLGTAQPAPMTFTIIDHAGQESTVRIRGELDIATISELEAAVTPMIDRGVENLTLDVGGLNFADSSAIALWVRWSALVDDLHLTGVSPLLRRVIETMGLAETLRLDR